MTVQQIINNNEQLPITISVSEELAVLFANYPSVCNKLEALFNFHTMTANWYGDEEKVLTLNLKLETRMKLDQLSNELMNASQEIIQLSDDVIIEDIKQHLMANIYIAVTEAEQAAMATHNKLLYNLTEMKLRKILNEIAREKGKDEI